MLYFRCRGVIWRCPVRHTAPRIDLPIPTYSSPFGKRFVRRNANCNHISPDRCPIRLQPSGSAMLGQVAQILPQEDHGFILNNVGSQIYFHRDSVTNAEFGSLKPGDPVHYVEEAGDAGPVATKVRVA